MLNWQRFWSQVCRAIFFSLSKTKHCFQELSIFSQTYQFLTLKSFAPLKSQSSNTAEIANKQNIHKYILTPPQKKNTLSNILLHQTWKIDLRYHKNDGYCLGNNLCRPQSFLLNINFSKEEEIDYFGCKICPLREVLINPAKPQVVYWKSMKAF